MSGLKSFAPNKPLLFSSYTPFFSTAGRAPATPENILILEELVEVAGDDESSRQLLTYRKIWKYKGKARR